MSMKRDAESYSPGFDRSIDLPAPEGQFPGDLEGMVVLSLRTERVVVQAAVEESEARRLARELFSLAATAEWQQCLQTAGVEFRCWDAGRLIRSAAGPGVLFYCDPPHLHETRATRKAYAHETTEGRHHAPLDCLLSCRGRVFLSGYRSRPYDEALAGWPAAASRCPAT